jgi:hypothetical protein
MTTNRTPVQVYALIVCFVALLCFVVTLGIAIYDIVQIAAPEFTYTPEPYISDALSTPGTPEYETGVQNERKNATKSLVQTSIILLIDLGVYAFHWKLANYTLQQKQLERSK